MAIQLLPAAIIAGLFIASTVTQYFISRSRRAKPSIAEVDVQTSQYGIPIPVVYGRGEPISGNLIWQANFRAVKKKVKGGKGGFGSSSEHYTYRISLAFGLCLRGSEDMRLVRGLKEKEEMLSSTYIFYDGTQSLPDPHIQADLQARGFSRFPVWKNLCYVVLPDFDLGESSFIPQFTWEIERNVESGSKFVAKFGTSGSGDGQFNLPSGIAVDNNRIYVVDTENYRVQIFDKTTYAFIDKFGSQGSGNGQFVSPKGIAVDDNYIYVADVGIHKFDKSTFAFVEKFRTQTTFFGIAVDSTKIYATSFDHQAFVFNKSTNSLLRQIGNKRGLSGPNYGQFRNPRGVAVDEHNFYVADSWNNRIQTFDKNSYAVQYVLHTNRPIDISLSNKFIYVSSQDNNAVTIFFRVSKQFSGGFGGGGTEDGQFSAPYGIVVSGDTVFVVDSGNNRIQVFSQRELVSVDDLPSNIISDILTNDFYGAGINPARINITSKNETAQYCLDNDFLISPVFSRQSSILDALQYVILHHDGFITYKNGEIFIKQFRMDNVVQTAENSLSEDNNDFVRKDGQLPILVERKGSREFKNKILVEFLDRQNEYVVALGQAEDEVDIDKYGVKEEIINLNAIKEPNRAIQMAWIYLRKNLFNPRIFEFELGIRHWKYSVGDVVFLTSPAGHTETLILNTPARIVELNEGNEGTIRVLAVEEIPEVYNEVEDIDYIVHPSIPPITNEDMAAVVSPIIIESPARYSRNESLMAIIYSSPGIQTWEGASVYKSIAEEGSYNFFGKSEISGITGYVIETGIENDNAYIDILLDTDDELESVDTLEELLLDETKNLMVVRTAEMIDDPMSPGNDIFVKFKNAELIEDRIWRLSGLVYDTVGFPKLNTFGEIEIDNHIAIYDSIPHLAKLFPHDYNRIMYVKAASFNFQGIEQDLSEVDPFSNVIQGLHTKPLTPFNVHVNGISLENNNVTVGSGDLVFTWLSRNRKNSGAYIFNRTDTNNEDEDFKNFELVIYSEENLIRTFISENRTVTYTSAQQTEDNAGNTLEIKLRQISTFGYMSDEKIFTVIIV